MPRPFAPAALLLMLSTFTPAPTRNADIAVRMLLTGDVMIGRGMDQVQRHSVDPVLYESYVRSATGYVALAERANGTIPRDADPALPAANGRRCRCCLAVANV